MLELGPARAESGQLKLGLATELEPAVPGLLESELASAPVSELPRLAPGPVAVCEQLEPEPAHVAEPSSAKQSQNHVAGFEVELNFEPKVVAGAWLGVQT